MNSRAYPEIRRPSWESRIGYESLREAERVERPPTERPPKLDLGQIHVAPEVFQWRDLRLTQTADDAHMRELVRVLVDNASPLDPLLVAPIGARFYVLDGHHRFDAYHSVDWCQPVPVEYFDGGLKGAQVEALKRNSKNKLPISTRDKLEAAWRLVRQGDESQSAIAKAATISRRTVSTMAKVLGEHPQAGAMTWRQARTLQFDEQTANCEGDWRQLKAQKWASQWAKHLPSDFGAHADIVAMALEILNSDFPGQLVHYWTGKDVELLSEVETEFDV
ncbi:ParB/RepB/Spo0J family partition protein [Methyloceanibacter sp. wino2]|uniref:ParB/RepB/Spo0J family partition protein n=1 Tax=Methyloceanibacter sp. wino2 TaxID=2170729 RepID=UPI000D3E03F3|nr:ParB/RepB/Spo0J family partition protein [Methyloceanibacter sp. wino2]